jgi:RimJ/RimL family protein N-acetyltransferase
MIRPLDAAGMPAFAAVFRDERPDQLWTERGIRHWIDSTPPRARAQWWLAEADGAHAGAVAMRRWWRTDESAYAFVAAPPGADEGAEALWQAVDAHIESLRVDKLITHVLAGRTDEDALRRRGFQPDRLDRVSVLDTRTADVSDLAPRLQKARAAGYDLVQLAEVDDLRGIFDVDMEVMDDMPGGEAAHGMSFDEWSHDLTESPDLSRAGSSIVVRKGKPVALALLAVDELARRGRNEETGTARAHRRRGLATLAKLATTAWARDNGIDEIVTDNAEANEGMLAINERLGYRPLLARQRWAKELT